MRASKIHQLLDLIEEIKKIDAMIKLHQSDEEDIMLVQYRARKLKLTSDLITGLNSPQLKSTNSFLLIKHFLDKFYTDPVSIKGAHSNEAYDLRILEAAL